MKHFYLLFIVLLLFGSCNEDLDSTVFSTTLSENWSPETATKPINSFGQLTNQLITAYNNHPFKSNAHSLYDKIHLLDSVSRENPAFVSIKPVNYTLLTLPEAQTFLNSYVIAYDSLSVSGNVKDYLNNLLVHSDLVQLHTDVQNDINLTVSEKELLFFVIDRVSYSNGEDGDDDDDDDDRWNKRMIVAAVSGHHHSAAQMVFNTVLATVVP